MIEDRKSTIASSTAPSVVPHASTSGTNPRTLKAQTSLQTPSNTSTKKVTGGNSSSAARHRFQRLASAKVSEHTTPINSLKPKEDEITPLIERKKSKADNLKINIPPKQQ